LANSQQKLTLEVEEGRRMEELMMVVLGSDP
jgi:hypothetical protein